MGDMPDLDELKRQNLLHFYKAGEVIAHEGDEDWGWFILYSGRICVFKKDVQVAEYEQRGTVFGELSGILQRPRTATIKALVDSEVINLHEGIDHLIHYHPDVTKKIMINLAERLAQTTENLWTAIEKK